jgi:hypothetical protein
VTFLPFFFKPQHTCDSVIEMSFSELYSALLLPFVKQFKEEKNAKGRKTVVKNASDAVKKSKEDLEDANDLPRDLETVCISLGSFLLFTFSNFSFRLSLDILKDA